MYHLTFTNGSNPYIGFCDDLDKWRVNHLITPEPGADGFFTARPAKVKVYRTKIRKKKDRYGCFRYEYDLNGKTLHFETYDNLSNLDALQRFYAEYQNLLLEAVCDYQGGKR